MKKLLAIVISMAMVLAMLPVGVFADSTHTENCVAEIGDQHYTTLQAAIDAAGTDGVGTEIKLVKNIDLDEQLTINKDITINGDNHTITTNNSEVTNPANKGAGILISGGNVKLENLKVVGPNKTEPIEWKSGYITVKVYGGNATLENVELTKGSEALQVSGTGTEVILKGTQNYNDNVYNGVEVKSGGKLIITADTTFTDENPSVVWIDKDESGTIENSNTNLKDITVKDEGSNSKQLGFAVASIGDKYYGSLEGAVAAVPTNRQETQIKILNNIEIAQKIMINENRNITLDLNGYNIVHNGAYVFDICNANFHVTGTGAIFENAVDQYAPIVARGAATNAENYTVVTIDENVLLKGDYSGIFIAKDGEEQYNNYGLVINMRGEIDLSTIGKADVETYGFGIYINGQNTKNDGYTPIINLNGVRIKGADHGIYAAGYAKWNIINSNIEGATGIEIRAGELVIDDAIITGNAQPTEVNPNGNGTTTDGVGIAIAQHNTKLPIDVRINNGKVSGYTAVHESNPQENSSEDIAKVKLSIAGGSFAAINGGVNAVYSEDITKFITGGTFSSDPTAYVADGYVVTGNGPFTVGRPYVPSTLTDNVTNADKSTTADLNPAVSDNKANTTVDADTAAKIVDKAVANKSTEVIIDAAAGNNVAASEVGIPEATVKELAEKTDANLVIKTDNGKVDLDKTALDAVAAQAGTTGTVKLIVETVKTDANICHVDLKLVTSNGNVTDFKGGNVKVTINLDKELAAKELVCVYINDNGIYTKVDGVLNADGTYTFTTGHFSEYAVMAKDAADKAIADQLNTLTKEIKLTARTSKTAKKNIKVTVNGDVTALKDAGYTVKYKFYRSTKKASKYTAKVTKDTNTYTNTTGKKGTKYYYKARVLVYDGDTLVAQTALKQCKYGARFWTK